MHQIFLLTRKFRLNSDSLDDILSKGVFIYSKITLLTLHNRGNQLQAPNLRYKVSDSDLELGN